MKLGIKGGLGVSICKSVPRAATELEVDHCVADGSTQSALVLGLSQVKGHDLQTHHDHD